MNQRLDIVLDTSYLPKAHTGHLVGSREVVDAFKNIYRLNPFKNILQFGFNTGWSTAILLTLFEDVEITSIEIMKNQAAINGVRIIEDRFPNRHKIIWGDSMDVALSFYQNKLPKQKFDCAFIDGGHYPNVVDSDIKLSKWSGIKNFIFDDGKHPNIEPAIKQHNDLEFQNNFTYHAIRWINNRGYVKKKYRINTIDHYLIK